MSIRLALECPTGILNQVQPLADFDWILAHLVRSDSDYAEYYRRSTNLKVLDNSVNELLQPLPIDVLAAMSKEVGANLIVAPDFLGESDKTMESIKVAARTFGVDKVIPVIQGENLQDVLNCFRFIVGLEFSRIAVPYDILSNRDDPTEMMAANRLLVVNSLIDKSPIGLHIHLLGFTTIDELKSHNRGWVKSIDTGVPVLLGSQGYDIAKATVDKSKSTMGQMGDLHHEKAHLGSIFYNIAYLRKVLNAP